MKFLHHIYLYNIEIIIMFSSFFLQEKKEINVKGGHVLNLNSKHSIIDYYNENFKEFHGRKRSGFLVFFFTK